MASRLPPAISELNQTRGEVRWGVVAMIEAGFERQDIIDYIDQNMPRNSEHMNNNWGLRTEFDMYYQMEKHSDGIRSRGRSDLLRKLLMGTEATKQTLTHRNTKKQNYAVTQVSVR